MKEDNPRDNNNPCDARAFFGDEYVDSIFARIEEMEKEEAERLMTDHTTQQLIAIGMMVVGTCIVIYSVIRLILIYQGVD